MSVKSRAVEFARSVRAKFAATPGHAVLGYDRAAKIKEIAQNIWDTAQANSKRYEEEARKWKYEQRESYVCIALRLTDDRVSTRPFYEVRTVTDIEGCRAPGWGRGWTIEEAECECRFRLAQMFFKSNLVPNYDEARDRAARVELTVERSFAMGTKGVA